MGGFILREFSDEVLLTSLDRTEANPTNDDLLGQEAEVANEQGLIFAATFVADKERAIINLIEDVSDDDLPEPLRLELQSTLQAAIARLSRAADRTKIQDRTIQFATKSIETTTRSGVK